MSWRERFWGRSVVAWRALSLPVSGFEVQHPSNSGAGGPARGAPALRWGRIEPCHCHCHDTVGVVVGVTDPGVLIGE